MSSPLPPPPPFWVPLHCGRCCTRDLEGFTCILCACMCVILAIGKGDDVKYSRCDNISQKEDWSIHRLVLACLNHKLRRVSLVEMRFRCGALEPRLVKGGTQNCRFGPREKLCAPPQVLCAHVQHLLGVSICAGAVGSHYQG